jgi:ribosome maturation factor RimP
MPARDEIDHHENLEGRIRDLAEPAAASMGLEIVLVEIKGGSHRPVVRAYIDRPGGITLADCERFSKRLSVLLDVEDWIPYRYTLEVSSPGLDRPLVKEADFQRFAGNSARIQTRRPLEGQKNFKGRIQGAADGVVALETEQGKRVEIAVGEIKKANLIMET